MSEEAIEQPTEVSATPLPQTSEPEVGTPVQTRTEPAPAEVPLDELLSQFDKDVTPAPQQVQPNELEQLLAELQQANEQQQLNEKMGAVAQENAALQQQIAREKFDRDFQEFSGELQKEIPEYLGPTFAADRLTLAAMKNPDLVYAFQHRGANREEVHKRLLVVETALAGLQRNPYMAQELGEAKIRELFAEGHRLGLQLNAKAMIAKARRDVLKHADSIPNPIDRAEQREQLEIREAIAHSMRSGSGKPAPEPPPRLGQMSTYEWNQYLKSIGLPPQSR